MSDSHLHHFSVYTVTLSTSKELCIAHSQVVAILMQAHALCWTAALHLSVLYSSISQHSLILRLPPHVSGVRYLPVIPIIPVSLPMVVASQYAIG